ncbi:hypothetical protein NADE_004998 [Nannochloris sp. 'desiccata']|nr:hypothetical protein NADE_004998 [Chlorella desiccata (nom. nud.)]
MVTSSPIEPTVGGLSFGSPSPQSSPLVKQTKIAIETLQEELSQFKKENEKLRGKNEAKAEQLKTLQQQMEAQAHRLAALDGRLAQGKGALSAACTAAQSKETEVLALREALESKDQFVREQAAAVARLDRMVGDGEAAASFMRAKEASLEQERTALTKTIQDLKQNIVAQETEARQQIAANTISTEAVHAQLKKVQADLAEEKSSRLQEQKNYELQISNLNHNLRRKEAEFEAAKQQGAAASADGAAGAASLRGLAERLVTERREWESERSRLLIECQKRLEEAERWMEKAATEADNQKKAAAAAAEYAAQQLQFLDNDWAKRADEAIFAARQDERLRMLAGQEAAAAAAALKRDQDAAAAAAASSTRNAIDSRMQELAALQQEAIAADYDRLHGQVERCLEALAERVMRHQQKTEKKQASILKHLRLLAAADMGAARHVHFTCSPRCPHGAGAMSAGLWDSDY